MSAKRPAEHQIDEKTLEDRDPISKPSETQTTNKVEIQRKIVEIKRPELSNESKEGQQKQDESKKTIQNQQKKQEKNNSNLFADLFRKTSSSSSNGTGLFASSSTNGLFSSNTNNLFSTGNSIFSNNGLTATLSNTPSTGLFSKSQSQKNKNSQKSQTIFNFQSNGVPPIKSGSSLFTQENNDNEQSGDSAQLQQAQKLESDPSKSTATYKYQQECQLIKKLKVHKFKKNSGDLIEWVDLYIQKDIQSKLVYIIAKLPATQKIIFSGLLIQNKSQIRHLNNKDQNVEVSCFNLNKTDKKTLQRTILKLQFQKGELGKQLYECVKQIIGQREQDNEKGQQKVHQSA